jgi:short-subunit dehydrogenase
MPALKGRVAIVTGSSGMTGGTSSVHYAAVKGGVIALTKSLGKEFDSQGITVQDLHEHRLSRAVLAQENVHLAFPKVEVHVVECMDARESLIDLDHLEHRLSSIHLVCSRQ